MLLTSTLTVYMFTRNQDTTTTSPEVLSFKHEPCSLKRRRQIMLKISTFNLLAPCYKRVAPVLQGSAPPKGPAHRKPFSLEYNNNGLPRSFSCVWDDLKANTVVI